MISEKDFFRHEVEQLIILQNSMKDYREMIGLLTNKQLGCYHFMINRALLELKKSLDLEVSGSKSVANYRVIECHNSKIDDFFQKKAKLKNLVYIFWPKQANLITLNRFGKNKAF